MVKKKLNMSPFSTLVQQIRKKSSGEYHLIDNEYFAAFNSPNDIQRFHNKLMEKQKSIHDEEDKNHPQSERDDNDMDMKTFAQQFLIDLPESIPNHNRNSLEVSTNLSKTKDNVERKEKIDEDSNICMSRKRQRRSIKDLPHSSNFLFMSDDDNGNIFDSLTKKNNSSRFKRIAYEDISSILLTLDVKKSKKKKSSSKNDNEKSESVTDLAEPLIIKNEPIEQEQLVITHLVETKEEPVQINVIPTGPMDFGASEAFHDLDNYVQNIHRSCTTNIAVANSSLRPKRIRKRKRLYIEESELINIPKRKRRKRSHINVNSTLLTDAEIERQFGERLSPTIKWEHQEDEIQENVNSQIAMEPSPIPTTPIEKARAKLTSALERGHGPDTFLLKIRSRDNKIFEIELAIYGTADWHSHRSKILSKIEEALRGLRVSWTKIDIRVDHFDVEICTSFQTTFLTSSSSTTNTNSSWFLKTLSEYGPLIVHVHDRRYPYQRNFIKCSCPQCSFQEQTIDSSLPVIVSVSPAKLSDHHLSPPTILRKSRQSFSSSISSLYNIHTKFFKELIHQYGTSIISSVTQCVLDIALIVSVHSSLFHLYLSNEDYETQYQQMIDPLKYKMSDNENVTVSKNLIKPDILIFHQTIKKNKANIRNAQSMKNLIANVVSQVPSPLSNVVTTRELILPKPIINRRSLLMNRFSKRQRNPVSNHNTSGGIKQQAHFTPIIELKPILGNSTLTNEGDNNEPMKKVTKIISTNTIPKDSQHVKTIITRKVNPRVIRLSISTPTSTTNSFRLVTPTSNPSNSITSIEKVEASPLVPKQINIIKPLTSSITPAVKLANPILISNKSQPQPMN